MSYVPSRIETATDQLLSSAFDFSLPLGDRIERLQVATDTVDGMLITEWPDKPGAISHRIRALAATACHPSLEGAALGAISHARAVGTADNLRELAGFLSKTGIADDRDSNIVGQVAEFSVLGLFWWGAANGMFSEKSYLFPATTQQDIGTLEGVRNGIDLSGKVDTRKVKIQVKNSARKTRHIYDDGIRVMSPYHITLNEQHGSRVIVSALEKGVPDKLFEHSNRLRSILGPSGRAGATFDPSVYKMAPGSRKNRKSGQNRKS